MFSKEILKEGIETLKNLKLERDSCKNILHQCIKELIEINDLNENEIQDEKLAIFDLNENLIELNKEINILEEQIFLNYTNKFKIKKINSTSPNHIFPHINTITS